MKKKCTVEGWVAFLALQGLKPSSFWRPAGPILHRHRHKKGIPAWVAGIPWNERSFLLRLDLAAYFFYGLHAAHGLNDIGDAVAGEDKECVIGAKARVADKGHLAILGDFLPAGVDVLQ